jgi:hypothetical protein
MYREVKKGRKTFCLAVDMGGKLDTTLQETLGFKFEV